VHLLVDITEIITAICELIISIHTIYVMLYTIAQLIFLCIFHHEWWNAKLCAVRVSASSEISGVEEIYPAILREGMVSALCRESHFIVIVPGFMWPKKSKFF